ncbi:hypothetical protein TNCV_1437831 [Trichonephila clavipes]|nr:hypothetical protein TNCV_1437831 [Trichonephila clavipes]
MMDCFSGSLFCMCPKRSSEEHKTSERSYFVKRKEIESPVNFQADPISYLSGRGRGCFPRDRFVALNPSWVSWAPLGIPPIKRCDQRSSVCRRKKRDDNFKAIFRISSLMFCRRHKERIAGPFFGYIMSRMDHLIPHTSILTSIVGEISANEQTSHYLCIMAQGLKKS